jgi:hypothetical protein
MDDTYQTSPKLLRVPFDFHRYLTDESYEHELQEKSRAAMREAGKQYAERRNRIFMAALDKALSTKE